LRSGHKQRGLHGTAYAALRQPISKALCFKDDMEKYLETLKYLETNPNIDRVDESTSAISVEILKELYENNLVDAIDCCSKSGLAFIEPKINMNGRQWVNEQMNHSSDKQTSTTEDIIDLKPNFMGFGVNFNALYRRFRRK